MTCPLCDMPWAEHEDKPCLHAVIAALEGKWVKHWKDKIFVFYNEYSTRFQFQDKFQSGQWWVQVTRADPWPKLVELWNCDDFLLRTYRNRVVKNCTEYKVVPEYKFQRPSSIKDEFAGLWAEDPALAVLIAWVVWKMGDKP